MGKRGPKPLGAAHHILCDNYRPSRHGPQPAAADPGAIDPWSLLKLPTTPAAPRAPDPIDELLRREGIEIRPEDRKFSR